MVNRFRLLVTERTQSIRPISSPKQLYIGEEYIIKYFELKGFNMRFRGNRMR